MFSGLREFSI